MIAIFKAIKLFFTGAWEVIVWIFQLPKGIVWGLVFLLFGLGRCVGVNSMKDEVHDLDAKLAKNTKDSKKQFSEDSVIILTKEQYIKALKTDSTLLQNLIGQYQVSEQSNKRVMVALKQELQASKELVKKAIDAGTIICDTLILERKQKLLSNKYYYVVIPKPDNLKSLIRD